MPAEVSFTMMAAAASPKSSIHADESPTPARVNQNIATREVSGFM
jgi:hypothetical protein